MREVRLKEEWSVGNRITTKNAGHTIKYDCQINNNYLV
jgi:hypothetical protein